MEEKTEKVGPKMVPPEGGYGWVVAFGSLLNTVMLAVPTLAFGVLLGDMIRTLGVNNATASWTISIQLWMSQVISPLCTMSINIFSCRQTAMAGSVIVVTGLLLSYFSIGSMIGLYITFGFITGFGMALVRIPSIVVGSQFFVKRYSIFSGIIFAGFSIGRVVFTPVCVKIKEEYGYSSTYLLLGGICLNMLVGTALFQPVQRYLVPEKSVETTPDRQKQKYEAKKETSDSQGQPSDTIKAAEETRKGNHYVSLPDSSFKDGYIEMKPMAIKGPSASDGARNIEEQETLLAKTLYNNVNECDDDSNGLILNPLYQCSSRDSINNLKVACRPRASNGTAVTSVPKEPEKPVNKAEKIKKLLKNSLDITLLKEPIFYIVCANSILSYLTLMYSTAFLIPLAYEKGIPAIQSSLIYAAKAGAEILGRLSFPFIQKFIKINLLLFYMLVCGMVGAFILGQALVSGFIPFMIFTVLSGFVTGGTVVMSIGVMMTSVGVKRYSSSLGLTCFIQGWFALFGGPLVGFVRDLFGNFSICYVLITTLQLAAIGMWGTRYCYLRWCAPKAKPAQQESGVVRR